MVGIAAFYLPVNILTAQDKVNPLQLDLRNYIGI